jgi:hypothetical protein
MGDIVPYKREVRLPGQVRKVFLTTCDEIVHPNHLMAFSQQAVAQV